MLKSSLSRADDTYAAASGQGEWLPVWPTGDTVTIQADNGTGSLATLEPPSEAVGVIRLPSAPIPREIACEYARRLTGSWPGAEVFYGPAFRIPNRAEIAVMGNEWDPAGERLAFETVWAVEDAFAPGIHLDVSVRFRGNRLDPPAGFTRVPSDCHA